MSEVVFRRSIRIERSAAAVFAWHERPRTFLRLCPPWERVEVLADWDWASVNDLTRGDRRVDDYCRVMLSACPYLRYLRVNFDSVQHIVLSHADTFALTPRLLSLHLRNAADNPPEVQANVSPVDFELMLRHLPLLTSLRLEHVRLDIGDLLDIALHSMLERLHIEATGEQVGDADFDYSAIHLPADAGSEIDQWEQGSADQVSDGQLEEEEEEAEQQLGVSAVLLCGQLARDAHELQRLQRMHAALTRTQPTQRSCEVRLALADWLHRRLRRAKLHVNEDGHAHMTYFISQMRRWCDKVAVIRCTLRQQRTELSAAS